MAIGIVFTVFKPFGTSTSAPQFTVRTATPPATHTSAASTSPARIYGRVDLEDGGPAQFVTVTALQGTTVIASAVTASDGNYTLPVGRGIYRVRFQPTSVAFAQQYSGDAVALRNASDVAVLATPVELNVVLRRLFEVTGRVSTADGAPVAFASVYPVLAGVAYHCCHWPTSTRTSASGSYSVRLARGSYRLLVVPDDLSSNASSWSGSAASYRFARDTKVDGDMAGPDIIVPSAGHAVTGRITRPSQLHVAVLVFRGDMTACCDDLVAIATEDVLGDFRLNVPDGTYFIEFVPQADGFAAVWWAAASALSAAAPVNVAAGMAKLDVTIR